MGFYFLRCFGIPVKGFWGEGCDWVCWCYARYTMGRDRGFGVFYERGRDVGFWDMDLALEGEFRS